MGDTGAEGAVGQAPAIQLIIGGSGLNQPQVIDYGANPIRRRPHSEIASPRPNLWDSHSFVHKLLIALHFSFPHPIPTFVTKACANGLTAALR